MKVKNANIPNEILTIIDSFCIEYNVYNIILAIGIQGGYARKKVNKLSDIDLVFVFESEKHAETAPKGFYYEYGVEIEVKHIYLNHIDVKRWESKQRYVYSFETLILYEKNNTLTDIINSSKMDNEEQIRLIVESIRKIGHLGIVSKNAIDGVWKNHKFIDPVDYWVIRNDLTSAHIFLSKYIERIISLIFAINKIFMPSAKHQISILLQLSWLPKTINQKGLEILYCFPNFTLETFYKRVDIYKTIFDECIEKAEEDHLIPDDFTQYYSKNFSRFNDNNV